MSELFAAVVAAISLAAGPPEHVAPAPEPEPFSLRLPAFGQLTSGFGPRWGRMHQGIDVGSSRSRP